MELKMFLGRYDTQTIIGRISFLINNITNRTAQAELGRLTSPMRQLYYLAGLLITDEPDGTNEVQFDEWDWKHIVDLLVKIENEHFQMFMPDLQEDVTEEWKDKVDVAMPTFMSYFNLGPLNYEEQLIEQIRGTFSCMDDVIGSKVGVTTEELLQFYEDLDSWCQYNFQSLLGNGDANPLRENWKEYTNLKMVSVDEVPEFIKKYNEERESMNIFFADPGIKNRFKSVDLATKGLSVEKVNAILSLLTTKREKTDFMYYTGANPLLTKPIIEIGNGMYQVFEEKRVLHAFMSMLEEICKGDNSTKARLTKSKGAYLENKIVKLFRQFFGNDAEIITNYIIDGCEQDILILWKGYMFVIEAKAYTNREPFRNTEKAFTRIKDDFNKCIGYAYNQCKRVEYKMKEGAPFDLLDKEGHILNTINPKDYEKKDYYIIVTQESFGQIQTDLSTFLEVGEEDNYPWAVRYYDLEIFILTLIAKKKRPDFFVDFLTFREYLHGHVICSDEGEICGGYIIERLTDAMADSKEIVTTTPDMAAIFDEQYRKGMGFENEKLWKEKHDRKTLFWG